MSPLIRKIYFRLSPRGRRLARRLYYLPSDTFRRLFVKSDSLVPPKGMSFVGSGNFELIGDKFFKHISEVTKILPSASVLDIGCGIGRIARPFTGFLNLEGKYTGFDILGYGINWCKNRYRKFKQFSFEHYPLKNDLYYPEASANAAEFVFPYNTQSFDLIILISVYTHMQKDEVENYFKQISRVIKDNGFCYASFFLTDENTKSDFFMHDFGEYKLHDLRVKDANVAFDKNYIIDFANSVGLKAVNVFPGWWSTGFRNDAVDFQDVIVFKKSHNNN